MNVTGHDVCGGAATDVRAEVTLYLQSSETIWISESYAYCLFICFALTLIIMYFFVEWYCIQCVVCNICGSSVVSRRYTTVCIHVFEGLSIVAFSHAVPLAVVCCTYSVLSSP